MSNRLTQTLLLTVCAYVGYAQSALDAQSAHQLAQMYTQQEDFDAAIALYEQLITQNARDVNALFQCATAYLKIGRINDALDAFTRAQKLAAHPTAIMYNIGYTYKTAGQLDNAIACYDTVIAMDPTYDAAYLARGFALLNKGDFLNGWAQHERYLQQSGKNADELRTLLAHNTIHGKRILLTYEGGLGDTLMFIRYAQRLKALGAYVICRVQKPLVALLSHMPDIDELCTLHDPCPAYDASASLMSLPAVFHDTEETMPRTVPYLYANPKLVTHWHQKLAHDTHIKIGLCWQADVHNDVSRLPIARRGMPLSLWHDLLRIPNIHVYSLQRFNGVEQIKDLPNECSLHVFDDMDTLHGSFMDTAALITQMDLIISVDTAIPHLAGALNKPVLLLLPYAVDWRWLYGRTDSPWYPTMRIFKQKTPFDWHPIVQEVHEYIQRYYSPS